VRHLVREDELSTALAQNSARDSGAWLAGPPLLVGGANFMSNAVSLLLVVVVRERGCTKSWRRG
jgi:hypothetical protein